MNGSAHAAGSGLALAIATYHATGRGQPPELTDEERVATAAAAGGLGALCGSLPDLIEPAVHPNHRQFFHSIAFAVMLGYGLRELYRWQPDEDWQRLLRGVGLIAGGAYLVHLAMDATTAKSLPFVGKL
ncbi:MAG TPA: metal-dependent hydrolase [Woeseiaceae bacterium]|nr:metal-dependent hydrolase [Woeseiaceae bacterium]